MKHFSLMLILGLSLTQFSQANDTSYCGTLKKIIYDQGFFGESKMVIENRATQPSKVIVTEVNSIIETIETIDPDIDLSKTAVHFYQSKYRKKTHQVCVDGQLKRRKIKEVQKLEIN